jgi:hypothetical protein
MSFRFYFRRITFEICEYLLVERQKAQKCIPFVCSDVLFCVTNRNGFNEQTHLFGGCVVPLLKV